MTNKKTAKTTKKATSSKPKRALKLKHDIVKLILEDHKPLKKLLKIMKDEDASFSQRKKAFEEFAPTLTIHAKSEEQALYTYLKQQDDLREDGFEGDVEHQLADEMVLRCKESDDEDLTGAQIKILAELVEHHIKEEEEDVLPDFKKQSGAEVRKQIGEEYMELKQKYQEKVDEDDQPRRNVTDAKEVRLNS